MPEHIRSLIVVLALSAAVFVLARAPACSLAMSAKSFARRRNLWLGLTLAAFLAHNFWLFILLAALLVALAVRGEHNRLALYFFVMLALPRIEGDIPGFGIINFFFTIEYGRLLSLAILLPAYLSLRNRPEVAAFGSTLADKLLVGYLLLGFAQLLSYMPVTTALRGGAFYPFIDVFLPYYVASRSLRDLRGFRDALMSFAVAALVLSPVLVFEFARHWLLYPSLHPALDVVWGWNHYLARGGNLRASGPIGHPIAAGYAIAVALAYYLYLRFAVRSRIMWGLGLGLLLAGLLAALSRGPWVGAAVMMLVILATGRAPVLRLAMLGFAGVMALPMLLATPLGGTVVDHLPFVGSIDTLAVEGRQRLLEVSMGLFFEHPFFGNYNYLETSEMQGLRGSDGIIDVVNTYVIVGLGSGAVGLSLFIGVFLVSAMGIVLRMRRLGDRGDERYVLGQSLLAAIVGILLMIGTVSPVLLIPSIYWCAAGMGIAYAGMLAAQAPASRTAPEGGQPLAPGRTAAPPLATRS